MQNIVTATEHIFNTNKYLIHANKYLVEITKTQLTQVFVINYEFYVLQLCKI